jgi:outer membrane lipoprotein-sorting protein
MKKLFFPLLVLLISGSIMAQSGAQSEKSDPEAKKVLDKIRKKYEAYKTLEAGFTLTIEVLGQPKEVQKGTISQEGDKFRLEMDQQVIVSDAKTTWVYLKKNNEVQINNAEPGSDNGFLTPKELFVCHYRQNNRGRKIADPDRIQTERQKFGVFKIATQCR